MNAFLVKQANIIRLHDHDVLNTRKDYVCLFCL